MAYLVQTSNGKKHKLTFEQVEGYYLKGKLKPGHKLIDLETDQKIYVQDLFKSDKDVEAPRAARESRRAPRRESRREERHAYDQGGQHEDDHYEDDYEDHHEEDYGDDDRYGDDHYEDDHYDDDRYGDDRGSDRDYRAERRVAQKPEGIPTWAKVLFWVALAIILIIIKVVIRLS